MLIACTIHLPLCTGSIGNLNSTPRGRLRYNHRVLMTVATALSTISHRACHRFLIPSGSDQHRSAWLRNLICSRGIHNLMMMLFLICIIRLCCLFCTAGRLASSWRFLWFRVERYDFMNLLQHLDQSPHALHILDILCFHLLDILGNWHVRAFENIYCKV